jgi:hypothetical protein
MADPSTSPTIDLSAGLVPKQQAAAPSASGGAVDLSSGLVAKSTADAAPGTTGVTGILNKIGEGGAAVASGFEKGVGDTISGVSHTLNKIPAVGETLAPSQGVSALDKIDQSQGTAEAAGKGLENIAEFAAGDELLSGLSKGVKLVALAKKYPMIADALNLATAHPWLAKVITEGGKGAVVGGAEGAVKGAQQGNAVEGAKTGAELGGAGGAVFGAASGAYDAARVSSLRVNPWANASKIEPAVEASVAKAGLPAGTPEVTPAAAKELNATAKADAQAATQKNIDQTVQNLAQQHAATHGISAPAAGTATRDLLQANGDALIDSAKADYKVLDKYTNGQFTNAQQELKNAQFERRTSAGKTGVDMSDLEANVIRAQMKVDQLFDTATANGMPKDVADTARSKFAAGQATLDVAHDLRMANKVSGTAGARITNLNQLENRLTARYDTGRLQQAFGSEQAAQNVLASVRSAREVAQEFEALPATEAHALRDLITKHTTTGRFGATTDWVELRKTFSKMADRGSRFSDVPQIEKFINDQASLQRIKKYAIKIAGATAAGMAGVTGYELAK